MSNTTHILQKQFSYIRNQEAIRDRELYSPSEKLKGSFLKYFFTIFSTRRPPNFVDHYLKSKLRPLKMAGVKPASVSFFYRVNLRTKSD